MKITCRTNLDRLGVRLAAAIETRSRKDRGDTYQDDDIGLDWTGGLPSTSGFRELDVRELSSDGLPPRERSTKV